MTNIKKEAKLLIFVLFVTLVLVTVYVATKPQNIIGEAEIKKAWCGDGKCSVLEDSVSCSKDCTYDKVTNPGSSLTPSPSVSL